MMCPLEPAYVRIRPDTVLLETGFRPQDVEDVSCDMSTLEDILGCHSSMSMGQKYGDQLDEWGKIVKKQA